MKERNKINKNNHKAFGGFGGGCESPPKSFFDSFLASKKNNARFVDCLHSIVNNS